jgi:hypothetical protein
LLPYPTPPIEAGALCQNGIDDDGNGLVDCDDPSCGECVEDPRITCPMGWSAVPLAGATTATTTCARTATPFDDCPTSAPAGATIVPATDDAIRQALAAQPRESGTPTGPVFELWLAPGRHVENSTMSGMDAPQSIGGHVAIHGLCAAGQHALIAAGSDVSFPFVTADDSVVAFDHVEIEILERPAGSATLMSGALSLDHVHVTSVSLGATVPQGLGVGRTAWLRANASVFDVAVDTAGSRVELHDSTVRQVRATFADVVLDRVGVTGAVLVSGATGNLVANDLHIACTGLWIVGGANARVERAVIADAPSCEPLRADAGVTARSTVQLVDVELVNTTTCMPSCMSPADIGGVDLDLERVRVATATGLRLGATTVAMAEDLTIVGDGTVAAALRVDGASLTGHRVRIASARRTAIDVTSETDLDGVAHLDHVYVDGVGEPAGGLCPSVRSAGIAARVPTLDRAGHVVLDVRRAVLRGIGGCAIEASPSAMLTLADVEVGASTRALCIPGATAPADLSVAIQIDATTQAFSGDASECDGFGCPLPASCVETGRCANGVDDDGDGDADCADTDCTMDTHCR